MLIRFEELKGGQWCWRVSKGEENQGARSEGQAEVRESCGS